MKSKGKLVGVGIVASLAVVYGIAISGAQNQDKYTLKVPGGLAFSEFKGYGNWEVISASQHGETIAVIVGNPEIADHRRPGLFKPRNRITQRRVILRIECCPSNLPILKCAHRLKQRRRPGNASNWFCLHAAKYKPSELPTSST